jgi:hypothetical protein
MTRGGAATSSSRSSYSSPYGFFHTAQGVLGAPLRGDEMLLERGAHPQALLGL